VLLRQSAQLHELSEHGAIDATFYERSAVSRHYYRRISYRVQKLKVAKLVDKASKATLTFSVQRTGKEVTPICGLSPLIRAMTSNRFVEGLRNLGIRPRIKHRIFTPYDHAHNGRINDTRYNQRSADLPHTMP